MSYTLTGSPATVTEGNQVTFTITRSGSTPAEKVYFSAVAGTASYAAGDYTTTSGGQPLNIPVDFASGATSATVTLNIVNDGVADSGEQFKAIVQRNSTDPVGTFLAQSGNETINDAVVTTTDTVLDTTTTSGSLAVGGAATGKIDAVPISGSANTTFDHDWYKVTLTANHSYTFSAVGTSGTLNDVAADLRDSSGTLKTSVVDSGVNGTATFSYTPSASDTY
jgi:hypothetical protein